MHYNTRTICRICLTHSKSMVPLEDDGTVKSASSQTILQVLEEVMNTKINIDEGYPNKICVMCSGLLHLAHDLKKSFEKSQKVLRGSKDTKLPEKVVGKRNVPVELIVGEQSYDLKDLVIIEEESPSESDYEGFLQNLGTSVSAQLVDKAYKYEVKADDHEVILIQKEEETFTFEIEPDEEGGGFQIKPNELLDIQVDDTEVDNYILDAMEGDDFISADMDKHYTEEQTSSNNLIASAARMRFQCDRCDKFYAVRGRYMKHIETCTSSKNDPMALSLQSCRHCESTFKSKRQLLRHVRDKHMQKKPFDCKICGKTSHSISAYIYHKARHAGRKFMCDLCSKKFYTNSSLKTHMLTHQNIPQVLCPVCGKSFNYKGGLFYHMRIHTKERNYECTYCDRRFYAMNSLKRHLRTHTGIRPYGCSYCPKAFFSRGEVKKHEYMHTGQRPYHCKHCKKGCTSQFNLNVHLMSHSGSHMCDICDRSFIDVEVLKLHMKMKHAGSPLS